MIFTSNDYYHKIIMQKRNLSYKGNGQNEKLGKYRRLYWLGQGCKGSKDGNREVPRLQRRLPTQ